MHVPRERALLGTPALIRSRQGNNLMSNTKRNTKREAIIYQGPSMIDGSPIVVIVTDASKNAKTGPMLQTWILRQDVAPHLAIKSGDDASICGDCPHRGKWDDALQKWTSKRTCYVKTFQAPLSVWKRYQRNGYEAVTDDAVRIAELGEGRMVRIGSYGDPMAVPLYVWESLTSRAVGWTGYTHQWRTLAEESPTLPDWQRLVMASADSEDDAVDAHWTGWRYFRVMDKGQDPAPSMEVRCPASKEAGVKSACATCKLCMGTTSKSRKSIAINIH